MLLKLCDEVLQIAEVIVGSGAEKCV